MSFQTDKTPCTCPRERTYLMLIWGRHYEGCRRIRKWPGVGVPLLVLASFLAVGALSASAGTPEKIKMCPKAAEGCKGFLDCDSWRAEGHPEKSERCPYGHKMSGACR